MEAGPGPELDPSQRIAGSPHSPLRVLAGPGTGKTFALIRRVARILEQGANPERILVSTFTRTAARDLQRELASLGLANANRVRAGTLHSYSFGLLSRAEVLTITGRIPRPLLNFEERFLLEDLSGVQFGGIRDCGERLRAFNAAWARLQSDQPGGWPTDPVDQRFHRELLGWLRFHQAMLVGEIVPEALKYLRDNPASSHRSAFEHVLVDEYQDLNRAEQVLLDLLSARGTFTVVGDENQSIYAFKHAHPEGISTFDQNHPGTHDENLAECRRCPQLVVEMANDLIAHNTNRADRPLIPLGSNPRGEVRIVQWRSMDEEANGVAQFILERIRAGAANPGSILVLAPRRQFGYAVRDQLNRLGVLAHSFFLEESLEGDPKNINESVAQQAFTLLTLVANPEDRVSLRCWCGFGSSSLRKGAWSRLRAYCETQGDSPRAELGKLSSGQLDLPYAGDLVERFRSLSQRTTELNGLIGQALVDSLFPLGDAWAEPLRAMAAKIEGDTYGPQELREFLRVAITQPELPTDVDYVRVMSLHKSKGLTADLVVVLGCIEGILPRMEDSLPQQIRERDLEEQRRLFFVAITRTRNVLVLSSIASLPRNLAYRMGAQVRGANPWFATTIASRFLAELGASRPPTVIGNQILGNPS